MRKEREVCYLAGRVTGASTNIGTRRDAEADRGWPSRFWLGDCKLTSSRSSLCRVGLFSPGEKLAHPGVVAWNRLEARGDDAGADSGRPSGREVLRGLIGEAATEQGLRKKESMCRPFENMSPMPCDAADFRG